MSGDKGPRRNLGWDRGDTAGNSIEGLAYYLASQRESGVNRYNQEQVREAIWSSRHLNLSLNNPEHVRAVNNAVARAMRNIGQVGYDPDGGGSVTSMPHLGSYIVQSMRAEYAYTVTAEVESTSRTHPGTIYRTMVVWSNERLSAEQLVQTARDQGAAIARAARQARGRDYDWGRAEDWGEAKISLNVWARRG